jgi:ribose/xylose/arabinose/galactoside ABC-type transport system permease subunit
MQAVASWIESCLLNPLGALAIAFVFIVLSWKFDVSASSWFLVVAWAFATVSVFRTFATVHASLSLIERTLWTMMIGAIIGLLLVRLCQIQTGADVLK